MSRKTSGDNSKNRQNVPSYNRRRLIAALGAGSVAGLAGCGGDGGDPTDTSTDEPDDTSTDEPDDTSTDEPDDTSTETTSEPEGEKVLDRTWRMYTGLPLPADAHYNSYNTAEWWGDDWRKPGIGGITSDGEVYADSGLGKSLDYRPGVIDVELQDDFYWWTDENFTAEDVMTTMELTNWMSYPGDGFDTIVRSEQTGEYSFRLFLSDTFNRTVALYDNVLSLGHWKNTSFWSDYIQRFEDASTDEEIADIQTEINNAKFDDPDPHYLFPFKLQSTTESKYVLELRDDQDYTPHKVPNINYDTIEAIVAGDGTRAEQAFANQETPLGGKIDGDYDFSTAIYENVESGGPGAYVFNCAKPPTNSVHFRRAWAYMIPFEKHKTENAIVDEYPTGLMSPSTEQGLFSQEFLDSLENYGLEESKVEEATAEMEAGGFSQDSDGNWLFKEGDRAGDPMSFDIPTYEWMSDIANNSTAFTNNMADFGIDVAVNVVDTGTLWGTNSSGEYDITLSYWGGRGPFPSKVFGQTFAFDSGDGAQGYARFPETWEGPPIGEPDADPTETYEVASTLDRIALTTDETTYNRLAKTLTWAYNQGLPKIGLMVKPDRQIVNTEEWDWPFPVEENPKKWDNPFRMVGSGHVDAIPEEEQ